MLCGPVWFGVCGNVVLCEPVWFGVREVGHHETVRGREHMIEEEGEGCPFSLNAKVHLNDSDTYLIHGCGFQPQYFRNIRAKWTTEKGVTSRESKKQSGASPSRSDTVTSLRKQVMSRVKRGGCNRL